MTPVYDCHTSNFPCRASRYVFEAFPLFRSLKYVLTFVMGITDMLLKIIFKNSKCLQMHFRISIE